MDLEEALAQADVYAEETEVCTIDNDLRTITIPSGLQTVGVESDEDVRRLNFQMPKQYGEVDLSEFNIRINFMNANNSGDVYAVTDKAVSGDNITFSWLVGRNALAYRGNIRFVVCLKKVDVEGAVQQEFNTTVAQLTVLEGLETTEAVVAENPDIIEQILARLDELEESGGGGGTPGKDGVGISNIAKTGTAGLVDTYTITMTDETSYTFTVKNGENGNPGQDGTTPTIGENGNWYLGETDTGKPSRGETPNIKIGTVQTLDPGNQATASMSGTPENPLLNLGIPKGEKGDPGEDAESGDSYTLPIMSDTQLGGGKAVSKTDEDVPVAVDPSTGQLFVPTYPESGSGASGITVKTMQNTDTAVTLPEETPYDLYIFPEMAALAVTIANENTDVHFFFDSGATATTFSLQAQGGGKIYTDAYSIDANMRYEVSVLNNVAYIKGVSMSET